MKVKDYSYETFPRYTVNIDGALELKGNKENLRCRMKDVEYQKGCMIRFLFPNTILDEERKYPLVIHVQGSGWYKQDMNDHIFDFMPIVKAGYVYAIIEPAAGYFEKRNKYSRRTGFLWHLSVLRAQTSAILRN